MLRLLISSDALGVEGGRGVELGRAERDVGGSGRPTRWSTDSPTCPAQPGAVRKRGRDSASPLCEGWAGHRPVPRCRLGSDAELTSAKVRRLARRRASASPPRSGDMRGRRTDSALASRRRRRASCRQRSSVLRRSSWTLAVTSRSPWFRSWRVDLSHHLSNSRVVRPHDTGTLRPDRGPLCGRSTRERKRERRAGEMPARGFGQGERATGSVSFSSRVPER